MPVFVCPLPLANTHTHKHEKADVHSLLPNGTANDQWEEELEELEEDEPKRNLFLLLLLLLRAPTAELAH